METNLNTSRKTRASSRLILPVTILSLILAGISTPISSAQTQTALAPVGQAGQVYYAAFPKTITLDASLEDWAFVPKVVVTAGLRPANDPDEDGSLTFAVVADQKNLYFMAEVPDKQIIAGQNGSQYWLEDSLEFYTNFTGDLKLRSYKSGVSQITIPAANIGNSNPDTAIISGLGGSKRDMRALVWRTASGYALEASLPLPERFNLEHGASIGFDAHLNGASDTQHPQAVKLVWSAQPQTDQMNSSNTPATFGKLVFFKIGSSGSCDGMIPQCLPETKRKR